MSRSSGPAVHAQLRLWLDTLQHGVALREERQARTGPGADPVDGHEAARHARDARDAGTDPPRARRRERHDPTSGGLTDTRGPRGEPNGHARRLRHTTAPLPGGSQTKVNPMSQPVRTLGALALGAFIVAVAALSVRGGPVSGAPATTDPATHTITVTATGKTTVVPDVARVYLGVTANRPTVKAVRDAGAQAMTDIIAAVKALGVDKKDIQTTNVSLNPQYGNGSTPKVVGYRSANRSKSPSATSTRPATSLTRPRPRVRPT